MATTLVLNPNSSVLTTSAPAAFTDTSQEKDRIIKLSKDLRHGLFFDSDSELSKLSYAIVALEQDSTKKGYVRKETSALKYTLNSVDGGIVIHTKINEANGGFKKVAEVIFVPTGGKPHPLCQVKFLNPIAELPEEVKKQQEFNHPNIPKVTHVFYYKTAKGEDRMGYYQEMCETTFLNKVRFEEKSFNRENIHISKGIVKALDYMHKQNYAHGDIKRDNQMIKDGEGMVIDFGHTKTIGEQIVKPCQCFLSPEQNKERDQCLANDTRVKVTITDKTDVYQLGLEFVQLYMHSGFELNNSQEITEKMQEWAPSSPAEEKMKALIESMLSYEPKDRPTMEEVGRCLEEVEKVMTTTDEEISSLQTPKKVLNSVYEE